MRQHEHESNEVASSDDKQPDQSRKMVTREHSPPCLPDSTTPANPPVNSITQQHNKYKIVLVGDGGTGKSSYVARLQSESFYQEYVATLGVEKSSILVETSCGECRVVLWDTAGQEKLGPLRDSYYEDADAAMIFFDITSRTTYKNVPGWHKDLQRVVPHVPVVLCANKIDEKERKVKKKSVTYPSKHDIGYFEMSVKERVCLKEPLQYLLQQLTKEPDLTITESLDTKIFGDIDNMNI